jgi:hypothetical protein
VKRRSAAPLFVLCLAACAQAVTTQTTSDTPSDAPSPGQTQAIGSPSPEPSTASPEVEVELGYGARLTIGSSAELRNGPSSAADVIGSVQPGERVVITYAAPSPDGAGRIFGPVSVDGATWYPVDPESQLTPPYLTSGWLAIEEASASVKPADCLPGPASVASLAALAPQERLICYGAASMELDGDMALSGLGGMVFGTWEPWLAWPVNGGTPISSSDEMGKSIGVYFAPGVEAPELPAGETDPFQPVHVVGHFDDAASPTCRVQAPMAASAEVGGDVELYCRTHFVVTEIALVDP